MYVRLRKFQFQPEARKIERDKTSRHAPNFDLRSRSSFGFAGCSAGGSRLAPEREPYHERQDASIETQRTGCVMSNLKIPDVRARKAISACVANGERLLNDAEWVEYQNPPATKLALSLIAQEEFAKAFVLLLVHERLVPWSKHILRAINDHSCKQLVGVIIEYIDPDFQDVQDIEAYVKREIELGDRLPSKVASALNILRHEKIGRWISRIWVWVDPPEYDSEIVKIAEGKRDRLRQDAFYVRIGTDLDVISQPSQTTVAKVDVEYERARRYLHFARSLIGEGREPSESYRKVRAAVQILFEHPL